MTRTFAKLPVRFSRLGVVAALLGTLLLTWPGTTVHAGAAFIKAAQNPITTFGGPGSTTISWDTGNGQIAELWGGYDNQGPVNGPYLALPTGTADSGPIAVGQSASYYLYTPGKGRLLAPVLTVTVKLLLAPVDPCLIGQCITNVVPTPGGTFVKISFTTSQATVPALTVSKAGPGCVATATDVHATFPLLDGAQTTHTLGIAGLIAERTYHYLITAGNVHATGCFTTLKRLVTVNFAEITVIDDSDDLSPGDLTFYFSADAISGTKYGEVSVESDSPPVHPNRTIVVPSAPASLSLAVEGWDEDCGGPFVSTCYAPFCVEGSCPDHGSDGDYEWATASGTYNVAVKPNAVDGFGENFTAPFTISTTAYDVKFKVMGTYKVEYK